MNVTARCFVAACLMACAVVSGCSSGRANSTASAASSYRAMPSATTTHRPPTLSGPMPYIPRSTTARQLCTVLNKIVNIRNQTVQTAPNTVTSCLTQGQKAYPNGTLGVFDVSLQVLQVPDPREFFTDGRRASAHGGGNPETLTPWAYLSNIGTGGYAATWMSAHAVLSIDVTDANLPSLSQPSVVIRAIDSELTSIT